jgi:hypothetical protein
MCDISLNLNQADPGYYDYLLIDGDLALTSDSESGGADPVQQDILQALRTFQGEWYLDNTLGLPWFQQILIKNPDQSKIDALFINLILSRPGVVQLLKYDFDLITPTRLLQESFTAQRTTGTVDYTGTSVTGGS